MKRCISRESEAPRAGRPLRGGDAPLRVRYADRVSCLHASAPKVDDGDLRDGGRAVRRTEAPQQIRHVLLRGRGRDAERAPDLLVRRAARYETDHGAMPRRELDGTAHLGGDERELVTDPATERVARIRGLATQRALDRALQ